MSSKYKLYWDKWKLKYEKQNMGCSKSNAKKFRTVNAHIKNEKDFKLTT